MSQELQYSPAKFMFLLKTDPLKKGRNAAMALIKRSKPQIINAKVSISLPICSLCGKPFVPSRNFKESLRSIGCICPECERNPDSLKLKEL